MRYSLFIGKFQPLHAGHICLIRKLLGEGRNVCVGIKKYAPYNFFEIEKMFREEFKDEIHNGTLVIKHLPEIDEVVYGRKVGYKFRKIKLSKEIENISATKIREKLRNEEKL